MAHPPHRQARAEAVLAAATLIAGALLGGCGGDGAREAPPRGDAAPPGQAGETVGRVGAEMRNVRFLATASIALEIRWLEGELVPTEAGEAPWFDRPESFSLTIARGEIAIDSASLAALLGERVFAGHDPPVEGIEVEIRGDRLIQRGTLDKAVDVPFEIEGRVAATPDGNLLLEPVAIRAAGIPVGGLMELFDIEMDEVIDSGEARGLVIRDNSMLLDPEAVLPPPRIRGRVAEAHIADGRVVLAFGSAPASAEARKPEAAGNFMFFRGGMLRFGKLTMDDADLRVVDADPHDPFEFFLARYNEQLVAGYSRNTRDYGLVVFMPDVTDLEEALAPPPVGSRP